VGLAVGARVAIDALRGVGAGVETVVGTMVENGVRMTFAVRTGVGIETGVMSGIAVVGTVAVGDDVGSGVVVAVESGVAAPAPKVGSN